RVTASSPRRLSATNGTSAQASTSRTVNAATRRLQPHERAAVVEGRNVDDRDATRSNRARVVTNTTSARATIGVQAPAPASVGSAMAALTTTTLVSTSATTVPISQTTSSGTSRNLSRRAKSPTTP